VCPELRAIYTGATVDAATARLGEFAEHRPKRYPATIATWERAWDDFMPFLAFPDELRQIVCTTNAIESLNARFRGPRSRRRRPPAARTGRRGVPHRPGTTVGRLGVIVTPRATSQSTTVGGAEVSRSSDEPTPTVFTAPVPGRTT
jgi:hypothetical protein